MADAHIGSVLGDAVTGEVAFILGVVGFQVLRGGYQLLRLGGVVGLSLIIKLLKTGEFLQPRARADIFQKQFLNAGKAVVCGSLLQRSLQAVQVFPILRRHFHTGVLGFQCKGLVHLPVVQRFAQEELLPCQAAVLAAQLGVQRLGIVQQALIHQAVAIVGAEDTLNNVPIVHLQLAIGQLLVAHGSYNGVLRGSGFLVGDGIGSLAGHVVGIAVGGDCGRHLCLRCGSFGSDSRFGSFGGGLSALHTADDQRRQRGDQDNHSSNGGDDPPGRGFGRLRNLGGCFHRHFFCSGLLRRFGGFLLDGRFHSGLFGSSFFRGSGFFGDFLRGRYRFGFRGIVLPAVGADSASLCQFFLTKLTFFHEISSFSIQSFRIHGQSYPLSLPRTCPECKRNTKYLQIPMDRMRQISFLRDWHLQKGGKNDMILY